MREIDRKCAEILGWKNIEFFRSPQYNLDKGTVVYANELVGTDPCGTENRAIPYYSENVTSAINYLISKFQESNYNIVIAYGYRSWKVSIITEEKWYSANDENLAMAISLVFLKIYGEQSANRK